jgi:hypothetical protein
LQLLGNGRLGLGLGSFSLALGDGLLSRLGWLALGFLALNGRYEEDD